jgi:hypothetical protein
MGQFLNPRIALGAIESRDYGLEDTWYSYDLRTEICFRSWRFVLCIPHLCEFIINNRYNFTSFTRVGKQSQPKYWPLKRSRFKSLLVSTSVAVTRQVCKNFIESGNCAWFGARSGLMWTRKRFETMKDLQFLEGTEWVLSTLPAVWFSGMSLYRAFGTAVMLVQLWTANWRGCFAM